jgi:hypothetical protein
VQSELDKYFTTPNYRCLEPSAKLLFYAYAAGKFKSDLPCGKFIAMDYMAGADLPPEFCRDAAKGFAHICGSLPAGGKKDQCRQAFPSNGRDCKSAQCREDFSLYSALSGTNQAGCPASYKRECGAFFTKSPSGCSAVLKELGSVYCKALLAHKSEAAIYAAKINDQERLRKEELQKERRKSDLQKEELRKKELREEELQKEKLRKEQLREKEIHEKEMKRQELRRIEIQKAEQKAAEQKLINDINKRARQALGGK